MSTPDTFELLTEHPLWRPEDLGRPIPDTPHAVSVCLPTWDDVIAYEEGHERVVKSMQLGYPRFVRHPLVQKLFDTCAERFAKPGEVAVAFPSLHVAECCLAFAEANGVDGISVHDFGAHGIHAVVLPEDGLEFALKYWQHSGEIVSSRLAEAALEGLSEHEEGARAKKILRARIAEMTGAKPTDVFLYPTGMAALTAIHRKLLKLRPGLKTIQLGHPYVDLVKIQEKFGAGCHFFASNDANDTDAFKTLLQEGEFAGVFTDVPGNPLLGTASLPTLHEQLRAANVPLVVDETVGSYLNVNPMPYCDVMMTSLTKYFAGISDVMGGALILNQASPFYGAISNRLLEEYEDLWWGDDAALVSDRSFNFETRMHQINENGEAVADFLNSHPRVDRVYYPKFVNADNYREVMRENGGYGGLMSILLKDPAATTPAFYNALRVSKGPSLGANYSLACPYILLAHYDELDEVEAQGLSRWLVRLSVGLEPQGELIARLEEALAAV